MSDANYRPNGELQGDTKNVPDAGYKTGFQSDAKTEKVNDMGYYKEGSCCGECDSDGADPC